MGLLSMFRGRPPIRELADVSEFIDENAAFVAQKGIFEYSRARAGHYAKVLFSEPAFLEAVERSRWRAFPLGIAMVGELVEGVLRTGSPTEQRQQQDALRALVLSVFDRYPIPGALSAHSWREARDELDRHLQECGLRPLKRSFEIVDPFARTYFDLMPIHEKLRARDFPTMHNYLKLTLCNMHDELTRRMDAKRIGDLLRAQTT